MFEYDEILDIVESVFNQFSFSNPEQDVEKNLIEMKLRETFKIHHNIKINEMAKCCEYETKGAI